LRWQFSWVMSGMMTRAYIAIPKGSPLSGTLAGQNFVTARYKHSNWWFIGVV
jgi:hypothetical protein